MVSKKRRRTFLRAALVATAGGLAGCSGDEGSDDDDEEEEEEEEEETEATTESEGGDAGTEAPEQTETPTDGSVDTPDDSEIETDVPEQQVDRIQSFGAAAEETRSYLAEADNFEGDFVDRRSGGSPEIRVGVENGQFNWGFGPPAIRITTGTQVRWDWTGEGGQHNIVDDAGTFGSGTPQEGAGNSYTYTFDETGLYKYKCTVHDPNMRGVVFVEEEQTLSGYVEVDDWLSDYDFDGRLDDRRNESSVDITVGDSGNEGPFAFRPIAILVDQGTTINWDWTGRGGVHDITWEQGDLQDSNGSSSAANTYSLTLDEPGVYLYFCSTHQPTGGRGAIVVDDG